MVRAGSLVSPQLRLPICGLVRTGPPKRRGVPPWVWFLFGADLTTTHNIPYAKHPGKDSKSTLQELGMIGEAECL